MTPEDALAVARQRIARARAGKLAVLDLGDVDLTQLPNDLCDLPHLRVLALGNRRPLVGGETPGWEYGVDRPGFRGTDLSPLAALPNLQSLGLYDCAGACDLSPLAGLTELGHLGLSGCERVNDLSPLAGLTGLRVLRLSRTAVTDLSPLAGLTSLQHLDLSGCAGVSDVSPLRNLTALERLDMSWSESVCDLSPLAGLTELRHLDLQSTAAADVSPLVGLTRLEHLHLSGTPVRDLSPLAGLKALQRLDLSGCSGVADLSPLAGLRALQSLRLSGCTRVREFGPIRGLLDHLQGLSLHGCRFDDVPAEVCGAYLFDNVLAAVRAHFADLRAGADETVEVKVFVLGNGSVGKTQLCRRLRAEPYDPGVPTTHGVQLGHCDLTIDRARVRLNLWDFGGQDIYHGTHTLFVGGPAVFLLLWNPDLESGADSEAGLTLRRRPLSYWLDYVRGLSGTDMPVLVVQSRCESLDRRQPLPVPAPADFRYVRTLEFSARTDWGLDELTGVLRQAVRDLLARHPAPPIGSGRARVRAELREELEKPPEERRRTITRDEFRSLCDHAGGVSDPDELLKYLHRCGVVFHRPGLFQDRIVVDQSWALDAIYTLFHRRDELQTLLRYSNGRFTRAVLGKVWERYSADEQELFLGMMVNCGVCFRVREVRAGGDGGRAEWEYRAPEWLPGWSEAQEQLLGRLRTDRPGASAEARYAFLHDGILRTFLSRVGEKAGESAIYWKFGCWFYDRQTKSQVLVEGRWGDDPAHPGRGVITLRGWGDQPGRLVDALLEELQEIPVGEPPAVARTAPKHPDPPAAATTPSLEAVRPGPLPPDLNPARQVFVSYAWGDPTEPGRLREGVVDRLCDSLRRHGWDVVRDRDAMRNGDLISQFMLRIGRGQRVVVILSEKYLKSAFCLTELHHIYQGSLGQLKEFTRRVVPVTLEDARIDDPCDRADWAEYWEKFKDKLEPRLRHLGQHDFRAFQMCRQWHAVIGDMLTYIADTLHPHGFGAIEAGDFAAVREMLDRE